MGPRARQYLSVLNIHKLAWAPMLVGPTGKCPMGPCVKTALITVYSALSPEIR